MALNTKRINVFYPLTVRSSLVNSDDTDTVTDTDNPDDQHISCINSIRLTIYNPSYRKKLPKKLQHLSTDTSLTYRIIFPKQLRSYHENTFHVLPNGPLIILNKCLHEMTLGMFTNCTISLRMGKRLHNLSIGICTVGPVNFPKNLRCLKLSFNSWSPTVDVWESKLVLPKHIQQFITEGRIAQSFVLTPYINLLEVNTCSCPKIILENRIETICTYTRNHMILDNMTNYTKYIEIGTDDHAIKPINMPSSIETQFCMFKYVF